MTFGSVTGAFTTENGLNAGGVDVFTPTFHATNLDLVVALSPSVQWVNPNGGDWDTASNWSTDTVPTARTMTSRSASP